MNNPSRRTGYSLVILAALLWASSGTASKFLFQSGMSPFQLVQLRTTLSSATLLILLLVKGRALLKISIQDSGYFLLLGISLASAQFTYLYAISEIQVAVAILLQYQAPVFVALYTVTFAHKKLGALTIIAIAGAVFGCYLVAGAYSIDISYMNTAGIISGLASAVSFAWYSVQSEYCMRSYSPWTVLFYALLVAACIWNILQPPFKAFDRPYSSIIWGWIFFVCIIGTILPFVFYNKGIRLIGSTHASITATLEPITAAFIAYLFLNELMEPWQILGAGLVIGSIVVLQLSQKSPPEMS